MQLTNRSKQVSNKEMTLAERAYLPAIATGLAITIKHFFSKKVTIQYPEVKRYLGPVFRGRHILKRDAEGRERCTACGLCAVACPAEAISMVAAEREKGEENLYREEKYAAVYEVNMLRCIFCGLCEEACPKQAVYLRHDEFVPVFTERDQVIWGKDLLVEDMNNRYTREAWTKEEARALDAKRASGEVTNVVPRAIP
ncbi:MULTISPECIES: NuoI/complex I 23 kDa subunit family protein [Dyadobacter]|uniref:NADH-quinone oxidoreductase subunit I n=2 Tax=Dyadobacter TaxID=120831 RepID=A0A2P8GEJ8_9BACT|nr:MULTISPECIES: NADH-quinone oxidoreductase subunit I [Dyadobacter]MBZ1358363.1 NADH-quinone oxidoreductase subunit I [Dyadobacter fermentans]MDR6803007.1 NADH-quinone oxidoreductase subunit I [Dyadobacter fermentans]MDR7040749.1 NADH-quinone oxidoreductase subunit I [Dyadobacter sp. BE242]MDR7195151.1 NADH-quinone oxidoreductase subunit I [Dyadobacter sp. BE34]MDR7214304.1 NADH-quinone oxidoreductase subunit I [Dyadobacter sp. BE31]